MGFESSILGSWVRRTNHSAIALRLEKYLLQFSRMHPQKCLTLSDFTVPQGALSLANDKSRPIRECLPFFLTTFLRFPDFCQSEFCQSHICRATLAHQTFANQDFCPSDIHQSRLLPIYRETNKIRLLLIRHLPIRYKRSEKKLPPSALAVYWTNIMLMYELSGNSQAWITSWQLHHFSCLSRHMHMVFCLVLDITK